MQMGRSVYNYGKQMKERARQQKQIDKAAKKMAAKQQKDSLDGDAPAGDPESAGNEAAEENLAGEK